MVRQESDVPILSIEGNDKYIAILAKNIVQFKNTFACHQLLSGNTETLPMQAKSERGTAYLEESSKGLLSFKSLEDVLKTYPDFRESKILKSDTDGFDTFIIRGAENFLTTIKPILLFEFDPHYIIKNKDNPLEFLNFLRKKVMNILCST